MKLDAKGYVKPTNKNITTTMFASPRYSDDNLRHNAVEINEDILLSLSEEIKYYNYE